MHSSGFDRGDLDQKLDMCPGRLTSEQELTPGNYCREAEIGHFETQGKSRIHWPLTCFMLLIIVDFYSAAS